MKNTIVLIPTYNEAKNIRAIIEQIFTVDPALHVLVIDDNSPDGTAEIVTEQKKVFSNLDIMVRTKDRGFAKSYLDGFRWVLSQNKFDRLITMDADFSHDPKEIPYLLRLLDEGADVALGSRHARAGSFPGIALWRQILSKFAQRYVQYILGLGIRDCTSGFIAMPTSVLSTMPLHKFRSEGYGFLFELKYELSRQGYSLREHPVKWPKRHQGESKMSWKVIWDSMLLPWKIRLGKNDQIPMN